MRATLEQLHDSGADELMLQDLIAHPATRGRSHHIVADAFGLTDRR